MPLACRFWQPHTHTAAVGKQAENESILHACAGRTRSLSHLHQPRHHRSHRLSRQRPTRRSCQTRHRQIFRRRRRPLRSHLRRQTHPRWVRGPPCAERHQTSPPRSHRMPAQYTQRGSRKHARTRPVSALWGCWPAPARNTGSARASDRCAAVPGARSHTVLTQPLPDTCSMCHANEERMQACAAATVTMARSYLRRHRRCV